jgi:hypothetical protein
VFIRFLQNVISIISFLSRLYICRVIDEGLLVQLYRSNIADNSLVINNALLQLLLREFLLYIIIYYFSIKILYFINSIRIRVIINNPC